MSPLLPDGEYLIKNAAVDLYMDLSGGSAQFGAPIIGWELNKSPNQKWRITTVNGINEFVIKSSVSGETFVGLSPIRIFPPRIAVEPVPVKWSIEPVGEGLFRIAFPYMDGVISLPEESQGAQLSLPPWEGQRFQKWFFESA